MAFGTGRRPEDDQLRRRLTTRHEARPASVTVPYEEYHQLQALVAQFKGAADQSRRQVHNAFTAREPNRRYDYLEGGECQSAGISAHGSGTLPTGGLPNAGPQTRSSIPVRSKASDMLLQDAVPAVVEPVGKRLRYSERAWQQAFSLGPELPQFTNQAALVESVPASIAPDKCAQPT